MDNKSNIENKNNPQVNESGNLVFSADKNLGLRKSQDYDNGQYQVATYEVRKFVNCRN